MAEESSSGGFNFDMGDSGYAFKTLWKEATKAVQAIVEGVTTTSTERTKANTEQNAKAHDAALDMYKASKSNNTLFVVIFAVVIVGVLLGVVLLKNKQLPKKV